MSNDGHFSFTGNFHAAAPLDSSFINDNDDNPNVANTNINTSTSIGINNNSTTISNNINTNIINVDNKGKYHDNINQYMCILYSKLNSGYMVQTCW